MAEFSPTDRLVWNTVEIDRLIASKNGPIAIDLLRRGLLVEAQAKVFATGIGGGPHVRTGRLRSSISTTVGDDELGVFVDVGTNVEYGGFVELGTVHMHARPYLRPALVAATY